MAADVGVNLARVREAIAAAALATGRQPREVTLVAVSKTVPAERIRLAYAAGQRVFGENRVQEGLGKIMALGESMPGVEWHLIGHLQGNKARAAVEGFSLVESVDSLRLATRLDHLAADHGRKLPILLEVNVAGEEAKSGFRLEELRSELPNLLELPHLAVQGLMTVAPLMSEPDEVRPVFRRLRELRDDIRDHFFLTGFNELSMGMSGDFRVAIAEGATMVRIGRAIFGERPAPEGSV